MAAEPNEVRFHQLADRGLGSIPNKPFRPDTRVADDRDIAELPRNIMNYPVPWYGYDGKAQPANARNTVTLAAVIGWLDSGINGIFRAVGEVKAGVDGLTAAVKALGEKQGIDPTELSQLIDAAVSKAADKHLSDIGTYELRKVDPK